MIECAFRSTKIKDVIYIKEQSQPVTNRKGTEKGRTRKERDTEAIVVRQDGKTYADLLKLVKQKVKPGTSAGDGIKTVRKSRDGHLTIVVNKDDEQCAKEIKNELSKENELNVNIRTREMEKLIVIKDIDGVTSRDEVHEAICCSMHIEQSQCNVGESQSDRSTTYPGHHKNWT